MRDLLDWTTLRKALALVLLVLAVGSLFYGYFWGGLITAWLAYVAWPKVQSGFRV